MKTNRRNFIKYVGASAAVAQLPQASSPARETAAQGKADSCIFIWLGGGACQIDTWDPKIRGDAQAKKPGSYYDPIPTAGQGCRSLRALASQPHRYSIDVRSYERLTTMSLMSMRQP